MKNLQKMTQNRSKIDKKQVKSSLGDPPGRPGVPKPKIDEKRSKSDFIDPPPGGPFSEILRPWAPLGRHFLCFWVSAGRSARRSPFWSPKRPNEDGPMCLNPNKNNGFWEFSLIRKYRFLGASGTDFGTFGGPLGSFRPSLGPMWGRLSVRMAI